MPNPRRKKVTQHDTTPVLKSAGNCVTMNVADPAIYEKALADFYYYTTSEEDKMVQCDWNSTNTDTLIIKYTNRVKDFEATLSLFSTGCLVVQGQSKYCTIWIDEHYPILQEMYSQKRKNAEPSTPSPITASTPCKLNVAASSLVTDSELSMSEDVFTDVEDDADADTEETEYETDLELDTDAEGYETAAENDIDCLKPHNYDVYSGKAYEEEKDESTVMEKTVIAVPMSVSAAIEAEGNDDKQIEPSSAKPSIDEPLNSSPSEENKEQVIDVPDTAAVTTKIVDADVDPVTDEKSTTNEVDKDDDDKVVTSATSKSAKVVDDKVISNEKSKSAKVDDDVEVVSNTKPKSAKVLNQQKLVNEKQTLRMDQKITNNSVAIDNLEREIMARVDYFDAKYLGLENQLLTHMEKVERSQKREKEMEEKHKAQCKQYEEDIAKLQSNLSKDEVVINELKTTLRLNNDKWKNENNLMCKIYDDKISLLQAMLKEKDDEIATLKEDIKEKERNNGTKIDHQIVKLYEEVSLLKNNQVTSGSVNTTDEITKLTDTIQTRMDAEVSKLRDMIQSKEVKNKKVAWSDTVGHMHNNNNTEQQGVLDRYDGNPNFEEDGYEDVRNPVNENIILLMDSNRNKIREDRFWTENDSTVGKVVVSKAENLNSVIKKNLFNQAEHFVIGTGTNDTDRRHAQEIFNDLVNGAKLLHHQYPTANIYVSQIPPRKRYKQDVVAELNSLIERGMPEFVHVVLQKELGEADLHDEKHIKVKSVGKYVSNMKNKIREVLDIPIPSRDRNTRRRSFSPEREDGYNGTAQNVAGDFEMMKLLMNFKKFLASSEGS